MSPRVVITFSLVRVVWQEFVNQHVEAHFLGKKELFTGLAVEQLEQNWSVHPVLHLDLNTAKYREPDVLGRVLNNALLHWEEIYGKRESEADFGMRFEASSNVPTKRAASVS